MQHAKEIGIILADFRKEIYIELFKNAAHYIYQETTRLQGLTKFEYDGFNAFYTKQVHENMMKIVSYQFFRRIKTGRWSGGHSVSNMMEQEELDATIEFFDVLKLSASYQDVKEYILATIQERDQKGE